MTSFKFSRVCVESYALNLPQQAVSSAEIEDRLGEIYKRLEIPFGTLEKLSGVKSRYLWAPDESPSKVGTVAAKEALEMSGIPLDQFGVLFNCSVSRDFFEPATATLVHRNLGFPQTAMAMDITNACIGFSNGLLMVANLIESGVIKAGLIVSGENVGRIVDNSIKSLLSRKDLTREQLLKILPTFTLGCGATAFILCDESISKGKHKLVAGTALSATEFNDLCNGNGDFCVHQAEDLNPIMHTESALLISSAAKLGGQMWKKTSEWVGWSREDLNHIFCHQVGKQVGEAFYREMNLPIEKEFIVYKQMGNMVSAALPAAFVTGARERGFNSGDKILFTAFGSGLNSIFTCIQW